MQEELNKFEINNFWELVPKPNYQNFFKNKMDEDGETSSNHHEGIDHEETFALVAKI